MEVRPGACPLRRRPHGHPGRSAGPPGRGFGSRPGPARHVVPAKSRRRRLAEFLGSDHCKRPVLRRGRAGGHHHGALDNASARVGCPMSLGAQRYLRKPMDVEPLLLEVQRLLPGK